MYLEDLLRIIAWDLSNVGALINQHRVLGYIMLSNHNKAGNQLGLYIY